MELPSYVSNKPSPVQQKWTSVYQQYGGHETGLIAANTWLAGALPVETQVRERLSFDLDMSQGFIVRTEDGEEYISFKLADVVKDKMGLELPDWLLQSWASMINKNPIIGDIDHEEYDRLLKSGFTDEEVKIWLKSKPGIAKSVKAIYDEGKLWVRAIIDKRYRNVVQKAKGVSFEAFITRDKSGKVVGGDLLGFTFGVKHDPVISGTEIHQHVA